MLNQPRRAAVCTSPLSLQSLYLRRLAGVETRYICYPARVSRRDSFSLHVQVSTNLSSFLSLPPWSLSWEDSSELRAQKLCARTRARAKAVEPVCVLSIANTVHGVSKKEKFHDLNHWSGPFDKFIIARLFSGRLVHIYLRKIVRDDVFARYAVKTWIGINGWKGGIREFLRANITLQVMLQVKQCIWLENVFAFLF